MSSERSMMRNQLCMCGSGKKYKKCCKINSKNRIIPKPNVISEQLLNMLDKECWYHGTDACFDNWTFPPPMKKGEVYLIKHTCVFFAGYKSYAESAGSRLAVVSINSDSKILDTVADYEASENLRKKVMQNHIVALTYNIQHDYWHNGWKSGDVLRVAFNDKAKEAIYLNNAYHVMKNHDLTVEEKREIVALNSTRGFIELVCSCARDLGYDAIYGHEVDRHSEEDKIIAQPWMAVFNKNAVSRPKWISVGPDIDE